MLDDIDKETGYTPLHTPTTVILCSILEGFFVESYRPFYALPLHFAAIPFG